jgi:hypothetical protein
MRLGFKWIRSACRCAFFRHRLNDFFMKNVTSIRLSVAVLLGVLVFAPAPIYLRAQATESATQSLLDKARALEARGRIDMALQTWQQVLVADPVNTEALAGLARAAKLDGKEALASLYLDRLRAIKPSDKKTAQVVSASSQANPDEVYGPYVPYVSPAQSSHSPATPVPVNLGDSTPHPAPAQAEVTDVLPVAHYVPGAHRPRTQSHPDLSGSSTTRQHPASNPADSDNTSLAVHNAQYIPESQPQQRSSIILGQQYPQPESTSTQASTKPRPRRRPASSAARISKPVQVCPCPPPPEAAVAPSPATTPTIAAPGPDAPAIAQTGPQGNPPADPNLVAKALLPPAGSPGDPAGLGAAGPPVKQPTMAELEKAELEQSYSGWTGGTGYGRYRFGTPGFDRLIDVESPFEYSAILGKSVRATVVPRPVFLDSGNIDTVHFHTYTGTIPILGTLPANALKQPTHQTANGLGGEFQVTTKDIGLAIGYTPYEFLVPNITGRAQWQPFHHRFTIYGERDSVKDSQLSYAGLHDPGTVSPFSNGNIWGGVISTGGGLRLDLGNDRARLNVYGGGANLTGQHVLENQRYDGTMSADFRVKHWPGHGNLNVGGLISGMHYVNNESGMTYGHGGYFSPNIYVLATAPVTFNGYYKTKLHYSITGGLGIQNIQQNKAPYYPLDRPLQTDSGNAFYPRTNTTNLSYSLTSQGAYHFAERWYIGGFLVANNTNNYNMVAGGFFVRYVFKSQFHTETYPTGLFPSSGFRPLRVP